MKVYISTDMEGVGGVSSWHEIERADRLDHFNAQLAREVGWVLDGLRASDGWDDIVEVCVCDSHSRGENLLWGALDEPKLTHVKGYPRSRYMMEGLDGSFDVVVLLGYHARMGHARGVLDHTYSAAALHEVRMGGRPVGEVEVNTYFAGTHGVPVGLVSGDDVLEGELAAFFPGGVPFARTKEGLGRHAAKAYSPARVEAAYREATEVMLRRLEAGTLEVLEPDEPTILELDLVSTAVADAVAIVPGMERTAGRTVRYEAPTYDDAFRMLLAADMVGRGFVGWE